MPCLIWPRPTNPHILMLSPPLDMQTKWFAPHTAYSMAKFGMSLVVLGLAGEQRGKIAVNALWPRTTIATAAIKNLLGGDAIMRMSRKPEILAEAAYRIFHKPKSVHRQLPHRRHVPRRRRRHRLRPIPRRSEPAAAGGFLRARQYPATALGEFEGKELAAVTFPLSPCGRRRKKGCRPLSPFTCARPAA